VLEAQFAADFTTTHWADIQAARTATPERRQAVLDDLARRYWKPVFRYLQARGHDEADARDITQDFFVEVILGRDLFGRADPHKGRFRPYLLHCLKNFTHERHRRSVAACRAPDQPVLSLDGWTYAGSSRLEPAAPEATPDDTFHRQWAASLLELVLERLSAACRHSGLETHYEVFCERFVRPALEHAAPTPLEALAGRFGLTVKQVANRGETVRRRFRSLLLDEVRQTVLDHEAAEEELQSLLERLRR
jgi:RNA polymerase sigma factor (sigma-70 family)